MTSTGANEMPTETPLQVSVVLPAHNEQLLLESTVTTVIEELNRRHLAYEIIVVENGSTDATPQIAHRLALECRQLRVIVHQVGDYGEALYQGIQAARAPIVTTFDVDLFDFHFFDLAIERLNKDNADVIIASKRAKGAKDRRPPIRRILTFGFMIVLKSLVDLGVSDAHGMKLLRRSVVGPICGHCVMRGSLFDVELVVRASKAGLRIIEIPVSVRELRPPRTGVVLRTVESLKGAVRLRSVLNAERR